MVTMMMARNPRSLVALASAAAACFVSLQIPAVAAVPNRRAEACTKEDFETVCHDHIHFLAVVNREFRAMC